MVYQQHMCLLIDAEMIPNPPHDKKVDHQVVIIINLESREKAFKKEKTNVLKAQKQQKETYDTKHLQIKLFE